MPDYGYGTATPIVTGCHVYRHGTHFPEALRVDIRRHDELNLRELNHESTGHWAESIGPAPA